MGTIAARDCLRVIELTEQVVAALLVTARQGIALRRSHEGTAKMSADAEAMFLDLETRLPLVVEDRALDGELRALLAAIRAEAWGLYAR
jgi:histidine ammonia-lyase